MNVHHAGKHLNQSKQPPSNEENGGLYVVVPISPDLQAVERVGMMHYLASSWAFFLISTIEIILFALVSCMYGFAPLEYNPLIGPPIEVIDALGSKNPARILSGEYWRAVTAIFLNVGLLDLLFSLCLVFCMSYHLERRWGGCKWFCIYILSGIGGNIFGTVSSKAISVGNGGCIFGMISAMHVEMIFAFFERGFGNDGAREDEQGERAKHAQNPEEEEQQEEQLLIIMNENENTRCAEPEDVYVRRSSLIVIGLLFGMSTSTMVEFFTPDNGRLQKDWSVLYGGMISGILIGLVWNLFTTKVPYKSILFPLLAIHCGVYCLFTVLGLKAETSTAEK